MRSALPLVAALSRAVGDSGSVTSPLRSQAQAVTRSERPKTVRK
jgi:hypothetical protein